MSAADFPEDAAAWADGEPKWFTEGWRRQEQSDRMKVMTTTWEDALENMTISELYEEAAAQLREGYPIPVDVYYKLADAGYVLN